MEGTTTSTGTSSSPAPFTQSSVTTDTTLDVGGGDSTPVTFDELQAVMDNNAKAKKEQASETKAAAKEAVKEMRAPKEDKTKKESKEDGKQEKGGKDAKSEDKKGGEEKAEKPVEKQQEAAKPKSLKYKAGDSEAEIPEDAVFTVKVNGKEETISARDLVNQYSGKTDWTRKYSDLTNERREFQAKAKDLTQKIESIFNEKDQDMRIYHMASLMGVKDPVTFRKQWLDENMKVLENYYALSDDERKANDAAWEAKLYKHQLETDRKDREWKQAEQELNSKITKVMQTHGIDEEAFKNRYDQLTELYKSKEADQLKKAGKLPEDITPEFIAETIEKDRLWFAAEDKLKGLNLGWDQKTTSQKIMQLVEGAWREGIPASEMPSVIEAIYGESRHQKTLEEKKTEREEFLEGKKETTTPKRSKDEPVFFDDVI